MSALELVQLIDLSLGAEQPSGVVNFNYLQTLLHEIVKRLAVMEQNQLILWQYQQQQALQAGVPSSLPVKSHHPGLGPSETSLQSTGTSAQSSPAHIIQKGDKSAGVISPSPPIVQQSISPTSQGGVVPSAAAVSTSAVPAATGVTPGSGGIPSPGTVTAQSGAVIPSAVPSTLAGTTGVPTAGVPTGTGVPTAGTPTGTAVPTAGTPTEVPAGGTPSTDTATPAGAPTGASIPSSSTISAGGAPSTAIPTGMVPGAAPMPVGTTLPAAPFTIPVGVVLPNIPAGTATTGMMQTAGVVPAAGIVPPGAPVTGPTHPQSAVLSSGTDITGGIHQSSTTSIPRPASTTRSIRSGTSIVTAANDLGALERKIQNLEAKVNSFETLPELLERKGSDTGATPIRDMWNFTNLTSRVSSTEVGLDKASQLFDDVLGEVQSLKSQIGDMENTMNHNMDLLNNKVSASNDNLQMKLKSLESLQLGTSDTVTTDALLGLQEQLQILHDNSKILQEKINNLENILGNKSDITQLRELQQFVKLHSENTNSALDELHGKLNSFTTEQSTAQLKDAIDLKISDINDSLSNKIKEVETVLVQKVNIADLASLMPSSDGTDTGNFMAKLLELQSKLASIEDNLNNQPSIPSDLLDKLSSMQNAIDHLTNEFRGLGGGSGGVDSNRVEELGLHVAQIRERLGEIDRAMTALTSAVSQKSDVVVQRKDSPDGHQLQSLVDLQQLVDSLQQEHERLMGTAAHISHELEIGKEHTKSLYSELDQLKASKADKEQVAIEVDEKADRVALENKASREWVDSTFDKLDREIREAKSHILGHEEALRSALTQINEDVDGKLDRMELEPLKSYFDKKIDRMKTSPVIVQPDEMGTDDAAGFKKPLRFRCISCDKPVGIRPNDAVPALPQIEMMPGGRSFRPYTTYELELIRRHQKVGQYGTMNVLPVFPSTFRSAGGMHTMTRPQQRIRTTPLSAMYTLDAVVTTPPPAVPIKKSLPNIHDEMDIVGHDGHIYKGRTVKGPLLPNIIQQSSSRSTGRSRGSSRLSQRPSTTPPAPLPQYS